MSNIISIAAFMKRRIKALKYMPREDLLYWLMFHKKHGSLAYHQENGKILAAGVARPLVNPLMRFNHYEFNEYGETVYADQAASVSPQAFKTLIQTMKNRFPQAKHFMFRHCKTGRMKVWNLDRFLQITTLKAK